MEDSQFPDAPETPAPIFAYRALKGFIFGSPTHDDDDNGLHAARGMIRHSGVKNQENIHPHPRSHASSPSPTKGTAPAQSAHVLRVSPSKSNVDLRQSINTTPQKRKHTLLDGVVASPSPIKSILRPAGAGARNTPRAMRLQRRGVGVTFVDIGGLIPKSGDLEAGKIGEGFAGAQNSMGQATAIEDVRDKSASEKKRIRRNDTNGSPERFLKGDGARKKIRVYEEAAGQDTEIPGQSLPPIKQPAAVQTQPQDVPPAFDIDAYKRETEKDMKKLLRKFQKMREYARKVDADNMRLRRLVEDVQRENERLMKGEVGRAGAITSEGVAAANEHQQKGSIDAITGSIHQQQQRSSSASNIRTSGTYVQKQNEDHARTARPSKQIDLPRAFNSNSNVNDNINNNPPTQHPRTSSAPRLPPDRLAAARERVRLKAEQRKVSEPSNPAVSKLNPVAANGMALDGASGDVEDDDVDVDDDCLPQGVDVGTMGGRKRRGDIGVGMGLGVGLNAMGGETSELDWEAL